MFLHIKLMPRLVILQGQFQAAIPGHRSGGRDFNKARCWVRGAEHRHSLVLQGKRSVESVLCAGRKTWERKQTRTRKGRK